jgi:hypothetical protein
MSITASWFDAEKRIICYAMVDEWTWDELKSVAAEVDRMIRSVPHRVDVIIDFSQSLGEPPHSMLSHLRSGPLNSAGNWGGGVFVGVTPFLQVVLKTFIRVEPELASRYCIAHTPDEARMVILQRRATETESEKKD